MAVTTIQSICIVRLSALGDVLMLVPLVRTLQKAFPKATITWVISRPAYDLVEGMDGVEFVVIDKPSHLKDYWHFYQKMKGRAFDILLATQASFRANLLYPLIRAKRKIGYDKLRAKDGHHWFVKETISPGKDHTLDGFLKFSQALGIQTPNISWNLPIDVSAIKWAQQSLSNAKKPIICINPAASKPERSWLPERYADVIRYLHERWQAFVVLTGGPGEYDRVLADNIIKQVDIDLDLVGQTKPKQLLALIQQADMMICPDTGPSHMATAVSTPVIALHAVTSSDVSGPYLYRHLAVDCYPEAVKQVLNTTCENNVWGTHAHGVETMKLVQVLPVLERLDAFLDNTKVC